VLKEQGEISKNPQILSLVENINRLDLQLENSLFFSEEGKTSLFFEKVSLSRLIQHLRNEWDQLDISLEKDAFLLGDQRVLRSVFRNLIQNALIHGQATKILIRARPLSAERILISVFDNGKGFEGDLASLGREPRTSALASGNGIGLYLSRMLLNRLGGKIEFKSSEVLPGLCVEIAIAGDV
jgi:signal transduction histidine kinase